MKFEICGILVLFGYTDLPVSVILKFRHAVVVGFSQAYNFYHCVFWVALLLTYESSSAPSSTILSWKNQ